jgi:hypothetical protein
MIFLSHGYHGTIKLSHSYHGMIFLSYSYHSTTKLSYGYPGTIKFLLAQNMLGYSILLHNFLIKVAIQIFSIAKKLY